MVQRKRQVLFTESRRDRHATRQILRCFCGCVSEDLTRIPMGWLAGEGKMSRHPQHTMDGRPSRISRWLPRRHSRNRKEI